jgi:hypothetical protein
MIWTAQDVLQLVEQEVRWHKANRDKPELSDLPDAYKDGFIAGLEQVARLIGKLSVMRKGD